MTEAYAELQCHSNFSLLDGGSSPEALVKRAAELGLRALALTDRHGFYGSIRFSEAARQAGLTPITGTELTLEDGSRVTLLARSTEGYANASALVTQAMRASPRGDPRVREEDLFAHASGLVLLAGPPSPAQRALHAGRHESAVQWLAQAREAFGHENVYLTAHRHLRFGEDAAFAFLRGFAQRTGVLGIATNDVRYATPEDRVLYDVLICVREHTTLDAAALLLEANAERHLKSADEMLRLFTGAEDWVWRTVEVAERCLFRMDQLRYRLPDFPGDEDPQHMLRRLTYEGALRRYGSPLSETVRRQLDHELAVIAKLNLAGYFLIVWDIVRFCISRGILCQGRGSAANSAVCYCLGITAVDPMRLGLLFERFLSEARSGAPDIDLDIAHQYREEVIQYVYEKYGRDRAAMVCEVITYQGRSALRDVGKVLGLSLQQVDRLAKRITMLRDTTQACDASQLGVDLQSPLVQRLLDLAARLDGYPRHLSIHVGGMVVSADPLSRIVPIEPAAMPKRTIIQWDKDDAETAGLFKIDLLGLGMLSLLQDGFKLIEKHHGVRSALHTLDHSDPRVYELLCRADTVGVFQVESRAQMNCLPRLKPRCFYDLVVAVALIRPGPIQGDMVHPYLRRRAGEEPITYPHPDLAPILERTLGVPLFQEQGMRLAIAAAGFTPAEADQLRVAMGHKRSRERMQTLLHKLIAGMRANGYPNETIDRIVKQLMAFADYGFPESHAASFAWLVFASAWMKVYYPAEFYAALLNAQPMGFYAPATIVNDGKRHGVRFLPVDVQHSDYLCTIEDGAVRLGFCTVRGVGEGYRTTLQAALTRRPFAHARDAFAALNGLPASLLRSLASAGAFASLGLDRRQARWEVERQLRPPAGPLAPCTTETPLSFTPLDRIEELQQDYALTGISIQAQPLTLYRPLLRARGCKPATELQHTEPGCQVCMGGLVICRQRPGTAHGMLFMTLEDETGLANIVCFPQFVAQYQAIVLYEPLVLVYGKVERANGVVNVIARHIEALPPLNAMHQLSFPSRDFR